MAQITGEGPDGTPTVPKVTADGEFKVAVTGGIEGTVDIGVDPVTSQPPDNTPALPVRQVGVAQVEVVGAQALSAPLDLSGSGMPVRTVSEADIAAIASNTSATNTRLGTIGGHIDDVETNQQLEIQATQDVGTAVAAVETELQNKATEVTLATRASEATLATRASETTAQSILAAVDQVEGKLDTLHTDAVNVYGRLGDRRTSDGAAAGSGQVVRPLYDVADFAQTTPGTPTWYLQVRNTPGRLKSLKVTLQTTGTPFYVFVMDVAGYSVPPAAQPAITTRKHLGFANKGTGNDPGFYVASFDREEMQTYSSGILIVLSTTVSTFTPATTALASIEAYGLGVPS